jgi:hypothetical protein
MITLARENTTQAGVTNVEFLHGHIEDIPLPDAHVDVVISNCVINLSADKPRVLAEAFRVLRPGGRLGISDVIADDGLNPVQRAEAEQRTGCTTGTLTAAEYRSLLLASGFASIQITATADAEPGLRSAIIQATRPASLLHPDPAYEDGRRGPGARHLPGRAGHRRRQLRDRRPRLGRLDQGNCPCTGTWPSPSPVKCWAGWRPVLSHPARVPRRHRALRLRAPRRSGCGAALLAALPGAAGIWTIQTGIFPEDIDSCRLHQRAGFRIVGTRKAHRRPPWPLARRHPSRTPQYRHGDLTRLRGGAAEGPGPVP